MTGPFRLYPVEQRWWSMNDYGAVLDVMTRLQPSTVLEFGPGSSTLALIEGGAARIDCCEDSPVWAATYRDRLVRRFPSIVRLVEYVWAEPLVIPAVNGCQYDLALIDGPYGTERRPTVLEYCLARCQAVLMPTEDYKARGLRPAIAAIVARLGLIVEWMETGPLSGGFALVTRPC